MNSHYKLSKTILWTPILMLAIAQSGSVQGASFWYAPNGGLSAPPGTFLDGVSEDVLEDYDAFVTGTSSDLDNYSEVHSFNVTNSAALIVQEGGGASNAAIKPRLFREMALEIRRSSPSQDEAIRLISLKMVATMRPISVSWVETVRH